MKALAPALLANRSLRYVNLENNQFAGHTSASGYHHTPDAVGALAKIIAANKSLKKLNILRNNLEADDALQIVYAMPQKKLNPLGTVCGFQNRQAVADLHGKGLGETGGDAVLIAWEIRAGFVSDSMTSIDLSGNSFGYNDDQQKGMAYLMKAIKFGTRPGLVSVNLSNNNLGSKGLEALAPAIKFSTRLKSIHLGSNDLGRKFVAGSMFISDLTGLIALRDAVSSSVSLEFLDLSGNVLGPKGTKLIAPCFQTSTTLKRVNMLGNNVGVEGYNKLISVANEVGLGSLCGLQEGLTEADLSNQPLWPSDAKLLAWDLQAGFAATSLEYLVVEDSNLNDESYDILTEAAEARGIELAI